MASPSGAGAYFARVPSMIDEEEDSVDNSSFLLFQWARSLKPLHKAISIVILSSIVSAFVFSSPPIWRPFGVFMLHKLWDILRFLVLATGIGLGIINSKFWSSNGTDQDMTGYSISSDGGKEDSVNSKVPFGGLFYSDLQSSDSFDDKEPDYSFTRRTESGNERVGGEDLSASSQATATASAENANSDDINKLVSGAISSVPDTTAINTHVVVKDTKHDVEDNQSAGEKPLVSLSSAHNNMEVASVEGNLRFPQATDDLSLGTKLGNEQQRSKLAHKVEHRRGKSLEFSIRQEGTVRKPRDIHPVLDQHQRDVGAGGERVSLSSNAPSSMLKDAKRQSNVPSHSKANVNSASTLSNTSRHHRSQSAYNLNDLLMNEHGPRSKAGVSSQLKKRRNVSLSSDLDTEFTSRGVPMWLEGLPSPPVPPPFMDGFEIDGSRGLDLSSKQGEGSLRKAYTESLAPWRVAMPMDIPQKGDAAKSKEKPMSKEKKQSPLMERRGSPLSPSTPKSMTGSPSPAELHKKVDAFIARFHERMRLQRLESLERSRQRHH
ncbi:hypothetical protein L7F22_058316 [Adiantum nelumboides]|nr:hypothetical protein [Adiantum nelumboides]